MSLPGLGEVRPQEFYLSTHHTMVVTKITWTSWGGDIARGTGIAGNIDHLPPGEPLANIPAEKAYVTAWKGQCNGRPAYATVAWNFTSFAENGNGAPVHDLCDVNAEVPIGD